MKIFFGILGCIWSIPYTIISYLLVLFLKITGQTEEVCFLDYLVLAVYAKKDGWFYRELFEKRGYGGFSLGGVVFLHIGSLDKSVRHEHRHSMQYFWIGPFFIPVYLSISIFIYIFCHNKNAYYDNPFEIDSRKVSGQPVVINKEDWNRSRWGFW